MSNPTKTNEDFEIIKSRLDVVERNYVLAIERISTMGNSIAKLNNEIKQLSEVKIGPSWKQDPSNQQNTRNIIPQPQQRAGSFSFLNIREMSPYDAGFGTKPKVSVDAETEKGLPNLPGFGGGNTVDAEYRISGLRDPENNSDNYGKCNNALKEIYATEGFNGALTVKANIDKLVMLMAIEHFGQVHVIHNTKNRLSGRVSELLKDTQSLIENGKIKEADILLETIGRL